MKKLKSISKFESFSINLNESSFFGGNRSFSHCSEATCVENCSDTRYSSYDDNGKLLVERIDETVQDC